MLLITKKLSKYKEKALRETGMRFELKIDWFRYYNLAKAYYEHHGNLKVSSKFKTLVCYKLLH